ncbi:TPA: glycosyltransferase family 2 protein [Photobacterium damselae]
MEKDKVSVIVPLYNSSIYFTDAVKSIINQTYKNIEIILVDDGSDLDEYLCYKKYISGLSVDIKLFRKENGGAASARNYGYKHSTGDVIAFLDSDDAWLPDKISSQIKFLENSNLVLGNVLVTDNLFNSRYKAKKSISKDRRKLINDLYLGKVTMNTPTLLIEKDIFESVGGFNENLKYREDHFFIMCAADIGLISLDPSYSTLRRERSGSLSSVDSPEIELNKHKPFWDLCEKKFDFLSKYKAKRLLLLRLFFFYKRRSSKKSIEEILAMSKSDYKLFVLLSFFNLFSFLFGMLFRVRDKFRNVYR